VSERKLRQERREEEIWKGSCLTHPTKGPTRQKGDRGGDSEEKERQSRRRDALNTRQSSRERFLSRLEGRKRRRGREERRKKERKRRG
jgi:hypothetical protein